LRLAICPNIYPHGRGKVDRGGGILNFTRALEEAEDASSALGGGRKEGTRARVERKSLSGKIKKREEGGRDIEQWVVTSRMPREGGGGKKMKGRM